MHCFFQVHKYLPERAKIPAKVQKGKGGRHSKRGAVFVRRRFTRFEFPDYPDGWKPKGEERCVVVPEKVTMSKSTSPNKTVFQEAEVIEIDGFVIELEVDADEPLMVSREEPYKPPDYRYQRIQLFRIIDLIFCYPVEVLAVSSACRPLLR